MARVDLHTHTSFSDGELSPQALLTYAQECGLIGLSITDHDTLAAYSDSLFANAHAKGIELIMGIELSTIDEENHRYHILGYGKNLAKEPLLSRLEALKAARLDAAREMCKGLHTLQWQINIESLLSNPGTITRARIAEAVINHPDNTANLLRIWDGRIPSIGAFVEMYLIPGAPCYSPINSPLDPAEAITLIHQVQGIAVLAHPSEYVLKGEKLEEILRRMVELGIDGLEAISIVHDRTQNDKPNEHRSYLTKFAQSHDLLITGGSDFHTAKIDRFGAIIDLGFRNHPWAVEEDYFHNLINALQ